MQPQPSAVARATFRGNNEIAFHVPDLAKAEAFYSGVLGFTVVSRTDDMLEIDAGGIRLYPILNPDRVMPYIPSIDVPNYTEARRALEAAGCTTVSAGPHSSMVYFTDPFGLVFDIVER